MGNALDLEIKFQNETTSDLERQIIKIVRKYAELKCKQERIEKKIIHRIDDEFIDKTNDDQLVNLLRIPWKRSGKY